MRLRIAVLVVIAASVLAVTAAPASTPLWRTSTASVFSDSVHACRGYGGYIVAHKSLPCGTRIKFCKARCAWARVGDRGPYVGGREFDLDSALASAIGFPYSVASVRWRRAR